MSNGTVKFYNADKGFGFITSDAGGKDIFVPSASLVASEISSLKPGQRVSFEEVPDKKGPKAVKLLLLSEAPRPAVPKERPRPPHITAKSQLTYYHDHTSEWSSYVLTALRDMGHEPVVVRYLETPPSKDQLRALSRLLGGNGQSLVRKFDRLFLDLRLDDRFIGDNEFWEAIIEHPTLIDGPLMATEIKASLCHSDEAIAEFFVATPPVNEQTVAKPKGLSVRALQILAGNAASAVLKAEEMQPARPEASENARPVKIPARAEVIIHITNKSRAEANPKAAIKKQSKTKAISKKLPKPRAKPVGLGKGKKSSKNVDRKIAKRR